MKYFCDMVKHKLRVASYELLVMSWKLKTRVGIQSVSSNSQVPSLNPRILSSNLWAKSSYTQLMSSSTWVVSSNPRVTSSKSQVQESFNQWKLK